MIITGEHITLGHSRNLLNNARFELREGMCVALMGINGSGKSTLLRSLCGIHKISNGLITLNNTAVEYPFPGDYVQKFALVNTHPQYPGMCSVYEYVQSGALSFSGWQGLHRPFDAQRLEYALSITGITPLAQRLMNSLSDGEKQKASIARAVMADAAVLLLDEPVSFLDIPSKKEIMNLLRQLADAGRTVVYSTHDPDSCFLYSSHIWLIKDGLLITGETGYMTEMVCDYFKI